MYDYLDLDMYIGITGWICDERRGKHLQDLIPEIPEGSLLLDRDAPYLLASSLRPKPKSRGNEPRHRTEVLSVVAQCRKSSVENIAYCTSNNAMKLFQL